MDGKLPGSDRPLPSLGYDRFSFVGVGNTSYRRHLSFDQQDQFSFATRRGERFGFPACATDTCSVVWVSERRASLACDFDREETPTTEKLFWVCPRTDEGGVRFTL
jgi:hypothetical protein